jgi:hypothetical protein
MDLMNLHGRRGWDDESILVTFPRDDDSILATRHHAKIVASRESRRVAQNTENPIALLVHW